MATLLWTHNHHSHLPHSHLPQTIPRMFEAHNCKECLSMLKYYGFPSLKPRDPNLFQHANASVYKVCSFVKVGVEELKCPQQSHDLNLTEHFWDELEC